MLDVIEAPVDVSPRQARYDERRLALLQSYYAKLVESGRVLGASYLLARDGKVFACGAMRRRSFEPESGPLRPDSIKDLASITKVITATAVMKLVEDGVLWLDQPVATLVPEFQTPVHSGITLWHLLTHTSGVAPEPGYYAEPYPLNLSDRRREKDWVKGAALLGAPRFAPGQEWAYSSTGFCVLAEVVSRASGRHFVRYVEDEIFAPLGMTRSRFALPEKLWPEVAWVGPRQLDIQQAIQAGTLGDSAPPGAGGAYSTLQTSFASPNASSKTGRWMAIACSVPKPCRRCSATSSPAFPPSTGAIGSRISDTGSAGATTPTAP
jgi:CubicO group peptidase (beta-lactamase class C family)